MNLKLYECPVCACYLPSLGHLISERDAIKAGRGHDWQLPEIEKRIKAIRVFKA